MSAARKLMEPDEFLEWSLDQVEKYELVEGVPVLKSDNWPEMMAGATERHDQIVVNLIAALRERLRGGPFRAKTAVQSFRTTCRTVRRPDVTIDCGPRRPLSLKSVEPSVFFEVLSPSTRRSDLMRKTTEYQACATVRHFALPEPGEPKVILWSRNEEGWRVDEIAGLETVLELPGVAVSLPMTQIYEDVAFAMDDPA